MKTNSLTHVIKIIRHHGVVSSTNRAFRHIIINTILYILPVKKLSAEFLYDVFESRSKIFPRVSDKNPLDLVWVDPNNIKKIHHVGYPRPPDRYGYVIGGDWDTHTTRFDEHFIHRSLVDRYQKNKKWEQTELYNKYISLVQNGDTPRGIHSTKELENYLSGIDKLHDTIQNEGYSSQQQLLKKDPEKVHKKNNDTCHPVLNEICINIGRDGELIKRGCGHHRLSIAKILNIDNVPVVVKTRHKEWQCLRNEIKTIDNVNDLKNSHKQYLHHPDLIDIRPTDD